MGMEMALNSMIDSISQSVPQIEKEYMGEDGLLHCAVCHKKTETIVEFAGIKRKVRCICDCKIKEREAQEEKERREERERKRRMCFSGTNMADWNFENDDRKNPKISDAMRRYCADFKEFLAEGKGLVLYGSVGTGKTYYAACVANEIIDNGYSALMTNFARLANEIQGRFEDKNAYIDSLNKYSLLIIDDLGAERKSEYMQEIVFNIIDSRVRSGKPFIVTTNLTAEELKKKQDICYSRIYDRLHGSCHFIGISGESRRRQKLKDGFAEMQERLGL